MSKTLSKQKSAKWQAERARSRGSARLRAAALALYQPLSEIRPAPALAASPSAGPTPQKQRPTDGVSGGITSEVDMSANSEKLKSSGAAGDMAATPADPRGVRIDGYFGPGLLRPGVGKLVQRTGEPQFCGSMAFRVFSVTDSPITINGVVQPGEKRSYRFSGEFMGVTFEGKQIWAADGYLPSSIVRTALACVNNGECFGFAGDLWCEPAEKKTPLGYVFAVYDRRPRGGADPLMQLAIAAGVIEAPALPAPAVHTLEDINPETGEIVPQQGAAA
jgi:hypothetical protein